MRSSPSSCSTRCRAPSGLCAPSRTSPGRRSSRPGSENGRRGCDLVADERLGGLACAAVDDLASGHEVRVRVVRQDDDRVRRRDGELLRRDRVERVAQHVRVVEADVREEDDPVRSTFVASWRPPRPASTTATSTSARRTRPAPPRSRSRTASRRRPRQRSGHGRPPPRNPPRRRSPGCARSSRRRAATASSRPEASESRSCSIVTVAVDLPFVPTTWIAGYASCGSPSAARSDRMRSSPKPPLGQGLMPSSHATALTRQPSRAASSPR